ncbi:MAG: TonB-dependent siderophore receptor [Verrucomicrobiota bacterium]|nr:TonB-dependent siderophore receptor [Verrucomicrobiota bacterium]
MCLFNVLEQNNNMKQHTTNKLTAVLLASCSALPVLSYGDDEVYELDDYVVSGKVLYTDEVNALKTPTPIIDVPQSLSILTASQISEQGFDSIGDIIDYTPGVNTSQGEGHRDAVVFRGVRSTADFFVDGVRDDVQYYRPLYNVDRVEILRGANGLFFGRGGTGGVLNRVMKKGVIGDNFNEYKLTMDTFGGTTAQFDKNIAVNETTAVRVNVFKNDLEGDRDFFYGDEFGINPTAKFLLSDAATFNVSYEYLDTERFIDRGIPTGTDGRPVEALADIVFGDEEQNYSELEAHIIKASLENRFSDTLKGRLNLTVNDFDKLYQNYYAAGYDQALSPDEVTLDGYVDTTQRDSLIISADLIGEKELSGLVHKFVVGIEIVETNNDNDRFNTDFDTSNDDQEDFPITALGIPLINGVGLNAAGAITTNDFTSSVADNTSAEFDVLSIYVQDEVDVSDKLTAVLGARLDEIDQSVSGTSNGSSSQSEISPRLGLVYKLQDNMSLYASYSEAFEPKSGEQYAKTSNDALDPNTFENKEIGVKWDLNKNLSFTAAIFELGKKSPVVDPNNSELVIDEASETSGFELQLQGKLSDRLYIAAGYSKLDGQNADNEDLRELPGKTFSVWNKYIISDKLSAGLGITYQDDSLINTGGTRVMPSYTRVDAAVYYKLSNNLRMQLNIENLTDELYFPNAHSTHQVTVGAPRNARIALTGSF